MRRLVRDYITAATRSAEGETRLPRNVVSRCSRRATGGLDVTAIKRVALPFLLGFIVCAVLALTLQVGYTRIHSKPNPDSEWRVLGFVQFAEANNANLYIVKGRSHRSRKLCYQDAVRLQESRFDVVFACAQIFPGGDW